MTKTSRPTGTRHGRAAIVATVTVVALIGAACGDDGGDRSAASPATTAAPTTSTTSPAPETGIDWTPCDPGFECAKVPVPLDWADPTGEQIELSVIRYP